MYPEVGVRLSSEVDSEQEIEEGLRPSTVFTQLRDEPESFLYLPFRVYLGRETYTDFRVHGSFYTPTAFYCVCLRLHARRVGLLLWTSATQPSPWDVLTKEPVPDLGVICSPSTVFTQLRDEPESFLYLPFRVYLGRETYTDFRVHGSFYTLTAFYRVCLRLHAPEGRSFTVDQRDTTVSRVLGTCLPRSLFPTWGWHVRLDGATFVVTIGTIRLSAPRCGAGGQ
ncbi:hypothetical protein NDU88_001672 [Pleurodeles waltl]|uniref:Uncharacterized protein n=1 Tax=Pleurodeles waltl TaxID=8319 RepID=A0AAV7SBJ5_PLEWA|nr:hypothetical protein NDU88_001672 [Pleurodeles waltl]